MTINRTIFRLIQICIFVLTLGFSLFELLNGIGGADAVPFKYYSNDAWFYFIGLNLAGTLVLIQSILIWIKFQHRLFTLGLGILTLVINWIMIIYLAWGIPYLVGLTILFLFWMTIETRLVHF